MVLSRIENGGADSGEDGATSDAGLGPSSTSPTATVPYMTTKLQQRLERLNDTPSKESLQTIARWCAFHRRPPKSNQICDGMLRSIILLTGNDGGGTAPSVNRAMLYMYALNELLMCDAPVIVGSTTTETAPDSSSKRIFGPLKMWDNLAQLRVLMGETVIVPALEHIAKLMRAGNVNDADTIEGHKDHLFHMIDGWESVNAFDSPSLTEQLRKVVQQIAVPIITNDDTTHTMDESESATEVTEPTTERSARTSELEKVDKESKEITTISTDASQKDIESKVTDSTKTEAEEKEKPDASNTNAASTTTDAPEQEEDIQMTDKDNSESTSTNEKRKRPSSPPSVPSLEVKASTQKPPALTKDSKRRSSEGSTLIFEKVDFEKEGIPQKQVMIDQILNPFQSIATTQIARDLRHDFVERLFMSLNSVPASVIEYAKTKKQKDTAAGEGAMEEKKVVAEQASSDDERDDGLTGGPPLTDYPEDFVEMDMEDAINKVEQYHSAVLKQREARSTCVDLLLASHCQFGSNDAAESFEDILTKIDTLKETKTILRDAMELEGIDMEENDDKNKSDDKDIEVEPLSWYKKEELDEQPDKDETNSQAKRQKTE